MIGLRFNRWIVINEAPSRGYQKRWLCQCDCGTERDVFAFALKDGSSGSCGCLHKERVSEAARRAHTHHGEAPRGNPSVEYSTWIGMIARCTNPRRRSFKDYGGRGITVCPAWRNNFPAFLSEVGRRSSAAYSIDRIDNSRGYEPGNVRWATRSEQNSNRRPAGRRQEGALSVRTA